MLAIPSDLRSKFEEHLRSKAIPDNMQRQYKKWLQYYLDFCRKYRFVDKDKNSLPGFINNLQEKKKTGKAAAMPQNPIDSVALNGKQGKGASWRAEYSRSADEIRVRHYSLKTLKTYQGWMKNFNKEFGKVDGVVRARRKPYIPVVLSRDEIDAIVKQLEPPYDLVVKMLYRCGLRLFECLNLRVQCLNFDAGILTVHDGKGQKDRTAPLPQTILPELRAHLESLKGLHQSDLNRGYAGVFLVNAPGTKIQKRCQRVYLVMVFIFLLQANYDIRTIQELLGQSDVRTTMIYNHTVKSVTIKEAQSPLDF